MSRILPTFFLIAAALVGSAAAALKVGDPAPPMQVGRWVQGEAVSDFEGDKVYIVEFWATWCGPCVASIPHVDALHRKFKDKGLVVVGQNVFEQDDKAVPGFVKNMGSKMSYRVALEDRSVKDGFMATRWLKAAGQNGIPCAFVVNKQGKIAFIGHPMNLKEELLERLLGEASSGPAAAVAAPAAPDPRVDELAATARKQLGSGRTDQAEATIAELTGILKDPQRHVGALLELELLLARGNPDDALQLASLVCEDFASKPEVSAAVASTLAGATQTSPALLDAAAKIATPLANGGAGQATALAVLARIAHRRGNAAEAIALQQKAVDAAPAAEAKAYRDVLESYRGKKTP